MKQSGIAILFALVLTLGACGGGGNGNTVNGSWSASLTDPDGTPAFGFSTTLTQSNSTVVTGTNLSFTTETPCFSSGGTETGGFTLTGNMNGVTTGNLELTIQSGTPSGNVLTLNGAVSNNTVSGTWTLTGVTSGCTGSGDFTMTKI